MFPSVSRGVHDQKFGFSENSKKCCSRPQFPEGNIIFGEQNPARHFPRVSRSRRRPRRRRRRPRRRPPTARPPKKGSKMVFPSGFPGVCREKLGTREVSKKGHFHLNLRSETRFLGGKIRTWFSSTDLVTPVFPTLQKVCKTRVSFRFPGVFGVQNADVTTSRKTRKITQIPGRNTHFWGVK